MNKTNKDAWNTKYGPRRVRYEAPTLEEAIIAAQGMSNEIDEQAEIAASLMGLPRDQVHAELLKLAPPKSTRSVLRSVAFAGPASAPRVVTVERKKTRRVITAADRADWAASRSASNG